MVKWVEEELKRLSAQALYRRMRAVEDPSMINFSTNDYLGLSRHPRVVQGAQNAAAQWGTGARSSRLVGGTVTLHRRLEERLAQATGRDEALVFPTGYMTNLGVIPTLVGAGDAVILDRLCHASIVDAAHLSGARLLVYRHADPLDAFRVLKRARVFRRRLLVTESLFSMDGDWAPLNDLSALAKAHDALFMVDDAHAFAVRPEPVPGDIVVGTLSKALASQGGFVAGSRTLIDWWVNKARPFLFTTALAPMNAGAALAALEVIQKEPRRRTRLSSLSAMLRDGLAAQGWDTLQSQSHIVPVKVGPAKTALALAWHLENAGFYAPAIRPPTVHAEESRLRFSVTAAHTESAIQKLLEVMREAKVRQYE